MSRSEYIDPELKKTKLSSIIKRVEGILERYGSPESAVKNPEFIEKVMELKAWPKKWIYYEDYEKAKADDLFKALEPYIKGKDDTPSR